MPQPPEGVCSSEPQFPRRESLFIESSMRLCYPVFPTKEPLCFKGVRFPFSSWANLKGIICIKELACRNWHVGLGMMTDIDKKDPHLKWSKGRSQGGRGSPTSGSPASNPGASTAAGITPLPSLNWPAFPRRPQSLNLALSADVPRCAKDVPRQHVAMQLSTP